MSQIPDSPELYMQYIVGLKGTCLQGKAEMFGFPTQIVITSKFGNICTHSVFFSITVFIRNKTQSVGHNFPMQRKATNKNVWHQSWTVSTTPTRVYA